MPRLAITKRDRRKMVKTDDAARTLFQTADSFQNFALKLGLGTDNAMSQGTYGFNPITRVRTLLEWIHRGSWLGGVAVDVVADDMTRAGIDIVSTMEPDDMEELQQEMNNLNIWGCLNDTVKWARLYGGCIAMLMVDGQDVTKPLRIETVGKGQFKGLMVLDRWMVQPSLNDLVTEYGPHFGLPKFYTTVQDGMGVPRMKIHYSRVLRMEGIRLPRWQRIMEELWGVSVLERLYDRMISFDSATAGLSQSLYRAYLRTYKIKDLRSIAAGPPEAMEGLAKYTDMMRKFQSIEGITLLDLEDEFEGHTNQSMQGMADGILQLGQQLSGALQIPLVRLFGQSPAGLNATGESDLRTYYDGIRQQQERYLRVPMHNILVCTAQSKGIKVPKGFNYQFAPLWQMKDEDKVNSANQITQGVVGATDAGLISKATALKELRQSSRITGVYSNITDEEIEEAENEPPPGNFDPETGDPLGPTGEPLPKNALMRLNGKGNGEEKPKGKPMNGKAKANGKGKSADELISEDALLSAYNIAGYPVVVEHRKGTERMGAKLPAHYGYIRKTGSVEGPDEAMDVIIGPDENFERFYVVRKRYPDGSLEEHKIMMGYPSASAALTDFEHIYGSSAMGGIHVMGEPEFHRFMAGWQQ